MSFFGVNPTEVAGLLDSDEAERLEPIPAEQWFAGKEGIATISALLRALANDLSVDNSSLTRELIEFQHVLETARSRNIRWHLAIDY
jgi:hypothetical protein